jgi:hypothetical protein
MSNCNTCGKSFGFFSRELGCARCNRLFCKKCLIYKFQDQKNRTLLCCLKCHTSASRNDAPVKMENVEKLLEIPDDPASQQPVLEPNLNVRKDKSDDVQDSNIDDIQQRLATLKGEEYKPTQKILFKNDNRTEVEKVEDLIKQFVEEKELNAEDPGTTTTAEQPGSIDDIERRLAALRGENILFFNGFFKFKIFYFQESKSRN